LPAGKVQPPNQVDTSPDISDPPKMNKRIIGYILVLGLFTCSLFFLLREKERTHLLENNIGALRTDLARKAATKASANLQPDAPSKSPPVQSVDPKASGKTRTLFDEIGLALSVPGFRDLLVSQQRQAIDFRYHSLFEDLKLSKDQVGGFQDLLVAKQRALTDAVGAAAKAGLSPYGDDRVKYLEFINAALSNVNNQIESVIGTDNFSKYSYYEQTAPQRATATALVNNLSYTSDPLSESQVKSLIDILKQTAPLDLPTYEGIGTAFGAGQGYGSVHAAGLLSEPPIVSPVSDQTVALAKEFLSPPQIQSLISLQKAQQDFWNVRRLLQNK